MKNLFKICFLMSFIFCQVPNKAEYFLSDLKRLDKLDEKTSAQIKKELNKIETKLKNELKFSYKNVKIEEEVSEKVITSSSISNKNKDILFAATLKNPNMTEYEYKYLEQQLSQNTYGTRVISPRKEITTYKNIKMNVDVFSVRPEWTDVVEFYGGYAELGSKNINKTDWENGKFDLSGKLTDIELISETEAMAEVYLSGYLKLNKIPKSNYKYKGTYTVGYSNIYEIYKNELPKIIFTFNNKKYMPNVSTLTEPLYPDTKIGGGTIIEESLDGQRSAIDMMFEDLVTDEIFSDIDDIKIIINNNIKEESKREEEEDTLTSLLLDLCMLPIWIIFSFFGML